MTDGRPQDQGRPHRRRGAPSAATVSLLADYQAAMRAELRRVLELLDARRVGLMPDAPGDLVVSDTGDRMKAWDLAMKLGRELGSAIEVSPPADPATTRPRARRPAKVDYG